MDCSILYWNCRGDASDAFFYGLLDLDHMYNPCLLVLVETKTPICRALRSLQNINYDSLAVSEANSFVGEIWSFRNSSCTKILVVIINEQAMTLLILKDEKVDWIFTPIYISPIFSAREALWSYICRLGLCINAPWLLMGDNNQPLEGRGKQGARPISWRRSQSLWEVIETYGFIDIGYSGPAYTWSNSWFGMVRSD